MIVSVGVSVLSWVNKPFAHGEELQWWRCEGEGCDRETRVNPGAGYFRKWIAHGLVSRQSEAGPRSFILFTFFVIDHDVPCVRVPIIPTKLPFF